MNSQLYGEGRHYNIPRDILVRIQSKLFSNQSGGSEGAKRAKNLVKMGYCTYPMLKRLKNFFDYCDPKAQAGQFELAGGEPMRQFVERTLQSERARTNNNNQTNVVSMPPSAFDPTLNLSKTPRMNVNESEVKGKKPRGAVAVIVNEDGKVLIVKRSPKGGWMPGKHALVGGGIEQGEEPIDAAKREVMEETGLKLEHFVDSFNILTPPETVDYAFVAKAPEKCDVVLNDEHTEHGWYGLDEIEKLDGVPMLKDCVELALNKMKEKGIYGKR